MRLSEELELALLLERRRHEFDLEWVKGVRKGWQQLYRQRKKFPGRVGKSKNKEISPKRDHKITQDAAKSAKAYLNKVYKFVELLQEDLYINKGFWHVPRKISKKAQTNPFEREKNQIGRALKKIESFRTRMDIKDYGHLDIVPSWRFHPAYNFKDMDGMNHVLNGLSIQVDETMEKINNQLNRGVWKVLNGIIKEISREQPGLGKDADNSLSIGTALEPTELNIGPLRVIFKDTPLDVMGGREGKEYIPPKQRASFIREMKKAWALLKKRKFGFIWYGDCFVHPPSSAYSFEAGGKKRIAGASYSPINDTFNVFSMRDASTIIHELGHRYYFMIMNKDDKDRFDKWYGEVKATSEYGSTSTVEDFAEVFMEYVLGKMDLDRDQIARFESAIGVKPRVDEPKLAKGRAVVGGLYGRFDKKPPKVAFVGHGHFPSWDDWDTLLNAIRVINQGNYTNVIAMYRRGITIQNVSSPDSPVVADPEGVLVFNMPKPSTFGRGVAGEGKILELIGEAYFDTKFVTPEMRKEWIDLWARRSNDNEKNARFKYSIRFRKMVDAQPINDDKVMDFMYWTFGLVSKPDWVKERQKKSTEVETPSEKKLGFKLLSPKQLYKKYGIDYSKMEWKEGRLSTSLVEALCD